MSFVEAPQQRLRVTKPGVLRFLLDRYAPRVHHMLTRLGTLSRPPELNDFSLYLRNLHSDIEHEIRHKTYIPITGREVPLSTLPEDESKDPFVKPIHQIIRQLVGISHGGDSASAQIAAVNRRSRIVRNILAELLRADEPLILLGDPGTGKTMTLKQTAMALAEREGRRVFPTIALYVRLGEFRVEGKLGSGEVAEYVYRSAPQIIRPYLNDLDGAGHRLVILFDGMDEMSRERYTEHTEALSRFASECRGMTKTLFSCRITDFSPKFIHQRLVLLPFNRAQIIEYLGKYIDSFPLTIDGENWTLKRLAKQLADGGLPIEANNPFVLWLLCIYLQEKNTWPSSRVDMLEFFNNLNYRRKASEICTGEPAFPKPDVTFAGWARLAYTITTLNQGAAVPPDALKGDFPEGGGRVQELIRIGKRCGVLIEAINGVKHLVRFEHQRFQEYFTALHIHHEHPRMSWLDKLDAPRWQETMLNLLLMGGADDAIEALAVAIVEPIRRHEAELLSRRQVDAPNSGTVASQQLPAAHGKESVRSNAGVTAVDDLLDRGKRFEDEEDSDDLDAEGAGPNGVVIVGDVGEVSPVVIDGVETGLPEPEAECEALGGWWFFTDEQETVTADRVELASRVLRQVGTRDSAVRAALLPPFNEAVNLLSTIGNPITQVKMLQACQNVPDLDFVRPLQQSLWSPINWVRDQALVVLAKGEGSTSAASYNFATEIAFDLAYGSFPLHILGYIKAALTSSSKHSWWCLASGTLCSLLNLLLLLSVGVLIFGVAALGFSNSWLGIWFAEPEGVAVYTTAVLVAAAVALKFAPSLLGTAILASSVGSISLYALITTDDLFTIIVLLVPAGCFVTLIVGGVIGSASCSLTLILFLALNPQTTDSGYSAKSFLSAPWHDIKTLIGGIGLNKFGRRVISIIVSPLLYFFFTYTAEPFSEWLNKIVGLHLHPYNTFTLFVAAATTVVILVLVLATRKIKLYMKIWGLMLAIIAGIYLFFGATIALYPSFPRWFSTETSAFVTRAPLALIILSLMVPLAYSLYLRAREAMKSAKWNTRPLAPSSITPGAWRKQLSESKPVQQHILLLRTNHQSLGIKADEYLEFLKMVRPLISSEPALSTYWSQRAQLEQVLKQERGD